MEEQHMKTRTWTAAVVAAGGAALAVTLSACGSAQPRPAAAVASVAPTHTVVPAPTVTVTQQPPKTVIIPQQPAPVAAPDPAEVVREFYGDLNAGDYAGAWSLGRDIAGTDYASWAAGYATTTGVTGAATDAGGGIVDATFAADHADGSVDTYSGTYTVSGGVIVAADISQTG
jgi:hypothetical protein